MDIKSQEQWVLYNLEKFYADPENFKKVANFIEEKSGLSLRLIDWFVTNYAKKHNTSFIFREFNVWYFRTEHIDITIYKKRQEISLAYVLNVEVKEKRLINCVSLRFVYCPKYLLV